MILVDTKYEFGKKDGKIYLIDEIHTPDRAGIFMQMDMKKDWPMMKIKNRVSKEFVREWLMENSFQGKDGQQIPEMSDEFMQSVSERYIELYENVSGEKFVRSDVSDPNERIQKMY